MATEPGITKDHHIEILDIQETNLHLDVFVATTDSASICKQLKKSTRICKCVYMRLDAWFMQRYYHFVVPPWELGSFCLCLPSLHLQLIMLHTVALLPQSNYVKIAGKLVPDENYITDTFDKVFISMQKDVCWWGKII